MMDLLFSYLELTALALMGIVLHVYRHAFGRAPLYMLLGMYFVFGMLADMPMLYATNVQEQMFGGLGYGMIWLPFLLILIMIYELEGTLEAHRFILGICLVVLSFFVLMWIVFGNYTQENFCYYQDFNVFANNFCIGQFDLNLLINTSIHILIYILVPVCFQGLRNINMPYGVCLYGSFSVFIVLNEAVMVFYSFFHGGNYTIALVGDWNWFMRMLCMGWLSLVGHFYLWCNRPISVEHRETWGFVLDFAGYFHNANTMRQSIREWAERYQLVINNSSDAIFIVTESCDILNANPAALKLIGKQVEDKRFVLERFLFQEDGKNCLWKNIWDQLNFEDAGVPTLLLNNLSMIIPNRAKMDIDISVSPGRIDGEEVAVVIIRDITIQKEAERRKQQRQAQMMHSQRLESIGELAGGVAHDFNNLLHGIQANVEGLQNHWIITGEPRALLDNIDIASNRAAGLIEQLLGFARKGKFRDEVLDVVQLLEQTAKLFKPVAKNVTLKILTDPTPMLIRGDSVQLEQVFLNMLINSKDALEKREKEKKIVVRAEVANDSMPGWEKRLETKEISENFICIRIKDNGCGISEKVQQKMFDPFFTTKEAGKGTGMGLAMAYGCIAKHHGWIYVVSTPNVGCEIAVFLKRYEKNADGKTEKKKN
ncbi:MAG: ATP-binding protein [Lentisphaeria bacterium]